MAVPKTQLIDYGFEEVKPLLFIKFLSDSFIEVFVDYRLGYRQMYAYRGNNRIDVTLLKEYKIVGLIEDRMLQLNQELPKIGIEV